MRALSLSMIQLGTAALLLLSSLPAHAGLFTDRPTWMASVTGLTTYDFGVQAPGSQTNYNTSTGLVQAGLGFTIVGTNFQGTGYNFSTVQGNAANNPFYDWGTGAIGKSDVVFSTFKPVIRITFTGGAKTAFGIDLATAGVSPGVIFVTPQGGTTTSITTQLNPAWTFYGITSATAFSYIDIIPQTHDASALIDSLAFGSEGAPPSETPEVSTMLSVAAGLALLASCGRKYQVGLQAS